MIYMEKGIPWKNCPVQAGKLYRFASPATPEIISYWKNERFHFLYHTEILVFVLEETCVRLYTYERPEEFMLAVRCLFGEEEIYLCFKDERYDHGDFEELAEDDRR